MESQDLIFALQVIQQMGMFHVQKTVNCATHKMVHASNVWMNIFLYTPHLHNNTLVSSLAVMVVLNVMNQQGTAINVTLITISHLFYLTLQLDA